MVTKESAPYSVVGLMGICQSRRSVLGLRHSDRKQAQTDPSPPFGGRKSANYPDEQAIELTFVFEPNSGKSAAMTYLSGEVTAGKGGGFLAMGQASEARSLGIKYRDLAPGVVQGS
jgi:hypothetical protein